MDGKKSKLYFLFSREKKKKKAYGYLSSEANYMTMAINKVAVMMLACALLLS